VSTSLLQGNEEYAVYPSSNVPMVSSSDDSRRDAPCALVTRLAKACTMECDSRTNPYLFPCRFGVNRRARLLYTRSRMKLVIMWVCMQSRLFTELKYARKILVLHPDRSFCEERGPRRCVSDSERVYRVGSERNRVRHEAAAPCLCV